MNVEFDQIEQFRIAHLGQFDFGTAFEHILRQFLLGANHLVNTFFDGAAADKFMRQHVAVLADTVGAGDTFNAGVLAALHEAGALTKAALAALPDAVLDTALSLGTRAAAVTVSRAGANPPWRDEL